jgi:hypothetical protein
MQVRAEICDLKLENFKMDALLESLPSGIRMKPGQLFRAKSLTNAEFA